MKKRSKYLGMLTFMMSICLVLLYMSMFVQIVIHEAGHLVFGLLSGYQFSSFRILRKGS